MNIYAKELIPHLVDSLKAIMLSNWNTESIRAVATFLASTVSKGSIFIFWDVFLQKPKTYSYSSYCAIFC